MGLFLGLSALGIALGPLAAGVVIQGFGWRAGFAAPALVAALGGLGVWLFAPEVKGATRRRLDGVGALGVGIALLALVFGVVGASSAGWSDPRVLQALAVGAGALVAFVWWERRVRDPLLDLSLFKSRALNAALLNGTLIALVMGGAILPLLYFFQNVQGLKPVPALLRIVPMVVAAAVCSPFVGGLVSRRGPRPVILGGLALIVAGCAGAVVPADRDALSGAARRARPDRRRQHRDRHARDRDRARVGACREVRQRGRAQQRRNAGGRRARGGDPDLRVSRGGARRLRGPARSDRAQPGEDPRHHPRLAQAVGESASTGAKVLPEGMERLFEDAFREAFTVGVARVFAVAALVALAKLGGSEQPPGPPALRETVTYPAVTSGGVFLGSIVGLQALHVPVGKRPASRSVAGIGGQPAIGRKPGTEPV